MTDTKSLEQSMIVVNELLHGSDVKSVPGSLQEIKEVLTDPLNTVQNGLDDAGVRFISRSNTGYQVFGISLYICVH